MLLDIHVQIYWRIFQHLFVNWSHFLDDDKTVKQATIAYTRDGKKTIAETVVYDMKKGDYDYYYVENERGEAVITKFEDEIPVGGAGTIVVKFRNGEPVDCKKGDGDCGGSWKNTIGERANTKQNQFESKKFFKDFDFALTEFRGLGYYSTWFWGEEELSEWRESVDKTFAQLYLGVEYWTSAVCSSKIERDQTGVAYVDTASGLAGVAAHVEATRSNPITSYNTTEYLYKITFYAKNGDWEQDPRAVEELKFNVYLYGDRTAKLLRQDKKLKKGEVYGLLKSNAYVQYSEFYYDKVCIKFDDVPSSWSLDGDEVCNTMQIPSGQAESVQGSSTTQQQSTTTSGGDFLVI